MLFYFTGPLREKETGRKDLRPKEKDKKHRKEGRNILRVRKGKNEVLL